MARAPRDPQTGSYRYRYGEARYAGGYTLTWYGEELLDRAFAAAAETAKAVATAAKDHAASNHPWVARGESQYRLNSGSGSLEDALWVGSPHIDRNGSGMVLCYWGGPAPALFLEHGTVKMPAYPFLRPAADATYGGMREGIGPAFR